MLIENLTRLLVILFGYAYPAFDCFNMLEQHPGHTRQLQFWCKYWIIVAILTVIEMLGDFLLPMFPMYNQTKLAFLVYLWHPKTEGADAVYDTFMRPLLMQYEPDIEERFRNLRLKFGRVLIYYLKNFTEKGPILFMEVLRYVVSKASSSTEANKSVSSRSRWSFTNKTEETSTKKKREENISIKKKKEENISMKKKEENISMKKKEETIPKSQEKQGLERLEEIAEILLATSNEKHRRT
ncbi:putative HVA22-like protein g [Zingiber officinale]|nr:putative HVA22-like protein g [Zingiber officinale]